VTNQQASYGISEQLGACTSAEEHAERVRLAGFTVVRGRLGGDDLRDLSRRIDALLAQQAREAGGAQRLAEIGEEDTARCCLAYDDAFLGLVIDPIVTEVCRLLLGDYFIVMQQNAVVNPPARSHTQRAYHRDLPYQHFVSSRPLAVSALFCVDAFTRDNGATVVLPGSHKIEQFPSESVVADLESTIEAPAGSFIVFDSMVFHRAGTNGSEAPRRAVNQVYSLPFIAQQVSLPSMLQGRYADDAALARLLGYGTGPVPSVAAWWERRRTRRP
jgi:ectoine hydroxylase-related dioxygenase (phytanoyl-CoA dioxygenase family)